MLCLGRATMRASHSTPAHVQGVVRTQPYRVSKVALSAATREGNNSLSQSIGLLKVSPTSTALLSPKASSPFLRSHRCFSTSRPFSFRTSPPSRVDWWPFGGGSSSSDSKVMTGPVPDGPSASGPPSAAEAQTALTATAPTQASTAVLSDAPSSIDPLATASEVFASPLSVTATEMTLSSWPNVRAVEHLLMYISDITGAPFWAIIVGCTLAVRVAILPLVIKGQANAARLANISEETKAIMADVTYHKQQKDMQSAQESLMRVHGLWTEHRCHPTKSFILPLVQMPLFITFFFALKGLAEQGLVAMKTGGYEWFTDLTAPDALYVGPILTAATSLATIETGADFGKAGSGMDPSTARNIKWVLRLVTCGMPYFVYHLPAAIFCYWITNNLFSLSQMLVLKIPAVRTYLDIPLKKDEAIASTNATRGFLQAARGGSHGKLGRPMSFAESVRAGFDAESELQALKRGESVLLPPAAAAEEAPKPALDGARRKIYEKWMKAGNTEATASSSSSGGNQASQGLFEEAATATSTSPGNAASSSVSPTQDGQPGSAGERSPPQMDSRLAYVEEQMAIRRRRVVEARLRRSRSKST